ncbi:hypothetical protein OV450_7407 [Actinobacteria bacterium OV450]|nr:hypothetical protein OV450_7407 [Actinobacteria bacterium OV450]
MGEGASSSTDRVERWRALLSGTDSSGIWGQALRKSGEVNLLTGVWLHAAARAEQGFELTALERSVLEPLEKVVGAQEVRAVGRVYREHRGDGKPVALVPRVVTERSLKEGFGQEAYRAALVELLPQIMALPNVAVVDRARLADGEAFDSPEFTAALAESGFGITGFTGAGDGDPYASAAQADSFHAVLEWDRFVCHEPVGDQGGGRDEIYWTAASNATRYQHTTRTGETGRVVRGEYQVPGDHVTGNRIFFDTMLSGCGSASISLWEADQSNSEWYDKLGQALQAASDMLGHIPDFADLIPTPALYGHVTVAVKFLATFWEAMRNKDDHVLTRGLVFGPADLKALYETPDRRWRWAFDARSAGMGNFDLIVRYRGSDPQPPQPRPNYPVDRRLWVTTTNGGDTWSNVDLATPDVAKAAPTLAVFGDRLHCAFSDERTWEPAHGSFDGTTWGPFSPIPAPGMGSAAPALAVFNDRVHCVTAARSPNGDHHLAHATLDGDTWTAFTWTSMPGLHLHVSDYPPALAVFDGRLYCFLLVNTGIQVKGLAYITYDGSTWCDAPVWCQWGLGSDGPSGRCVRAGRMTGRHVCY